MTKHPLLTAEAELSLARELERADLSITRALLAVREGRDALSEVADALRDGGARVEDVERNPEERSAGDALAERIERTVAAARRRSASRSRPRAHGLRLHPRTVSAIERSLGERLARERTNARLAALVAELAELRRRGDETTAKFVNANLRIVVTFARRYRGMPLVDLVQEGNLGLLRAVDKFDHRRGLRFSTYAAWWIRHALGRALADQSKMIRLPVHLTGAVHRVRRAQDRLFRETGREASPEELASRTGLAVEQVRRALDVVPQPVSLDVPVGGERDGADLSDFVPDASVRPADDAVAEREMCEEAHALLATLPEREAEILRLRYGVGGGAQRTLEEVGARMSLSRERARQLERDALRKLRTAGELRRVRAHFER